MENMENEVITEEEEIVFLSTQEVADKLQCSPHHITYIRRAGLLPGTRIGRRWLYTGKDVASFIKAIVGKDLKEFVNLTDEESVKRYLESKNSK